MTSPSPVQVYCSLQRMRQLCLFSCWRTCVCVRRVCLRVENKRYFEVKKSSLGLEFIRFWRDSGRNKGKEWEFFFLLLRYATTWALSLSLSTSSFLIGPHPLTQDSLLFWSSIISCNVLNLESPSKSSASLQLCLFLHFLQLQIAIGLKSPGLRIFLMEINSPVPGLDFIAQSVETMLWSEDFSVEHFISSVHRLHISTDVLLISSFLHSFSCLYL